ncbi:MAG TPA: hypothetical protein VGQ59_06140 [Cyclobacteriaceae bacterium]|nr:hypothetical protein [Cyclobacteriaceae bacterium]
MRTKIHRKMYVGAILMAFWSIILISQVANLRIQNSKFSKTSINIQATKGPIGSTNDNQSNPIEEEEEEEDDDKFDLESTLLNTHRQEIFVIKHYSFQDDLILDPHREIFSPPPQA